MNRIKNKVSHILNSNILSGGSVVSICFSAFLLVTLGGSLFAQTAMVTQNFVSYPTAAPGANYQCDPVKINWPSSTDASNRSFYKTAVSPVNSTDPWVNSALIEYDNSLNMSWNNAAYPAGCLSFCGEVTCSNPVRRVQGPESTSIFMEDSGPFPIQSVFFEIFKYQKNVNPMNPDSSPPIRTVAIYPQGENICYGVAATGGGGTKPKSTSCCDVCWPAAGASCGTAKSCFAIYGNDQTSCEADDACRWSGSACANKANCTGLNQTTCNDTNGCTWNASGTTRQHGGSGSGCAATCSNFSVNALGNKVDFGSEDANASFKNCDLGVTKLSFCAAWDGMYEIDGEFGKSNGQFGFRTTIQSKWPGDGVQTPEIDINHMIAYPGENQIPIQVDVTNVHSVRSTSSLVGAKVAVPAQPYNISYRLSKDALMTVTIKDPNSTTPAETLRTLISNEPRLGEGTPGGAEKIDTVTTEVESWDGRDDKGRILPMGNYNVILSAKSQDEWTGTANYDQSREVIRQLSLDPLKITDLATTGLNKTSTAYAMLSYMTTEAATVYVEVYSPGSYFNDLNVVPTSGTGTITVNGTGPTLTAGSLVARYTEQKASRSSVNTKWDGLCHNAAGCVVDGKTYTDGSPLPDGDYVYLIWAEIPYVSGQSVTVNGLEWTGVKTGQYYTGVLAVNRGLPDITLQPVGYSTIGSSPTAFGLKPFIFRFSLSRDSIISARIITSAADSGNNQVTGAPFTVKTLINNQIQVANQMNVQTWDGKDNNGRYVSPGNYLLEVTAADTLFPSKKITVTEQFPVDLFRVVDVATTPIIDEATSQATIAYKMSESMDVTLNIYAKNVVIPNPNDSQYWPPQACTSGNLNTNTCMYKMVSGVRQVLDPSGTDLLKTFAGQRPGEGSEILEAWDGYLYSQGASSAQDIMEDGLYPYYISAINNSGTSVYYYTDGSGNQVPQNPTVATGGFTDSYPATDKPTGHITIARGPVQFTSIKINASQPKLYYSSETVFIPTYEVQFATSRTANVIVQVRALVAGACLNGTANPGDVCRTLTRTSSSQLGTIYDPIVINKLYWDGKDEAGDYVATEAYEVRLTAMQYPLPTGLNPNTVCSVQPKYCTTVSQTLNVNNFQVFDRYIWDVSPGNSSKGKFAYQVSVPMKVAIQIFKPGTKIANVSDGTLVDPANPTGPAIGETSVREVLVKAIVGVRPHLIALEDVWDGTDLAGNQVPDGMYPFRFVTVIDSYNMNSVTGSVIAPSQSLVQSKVADWDKFINLGVINVANGDSQYPGADWKSNGVTSFFPNPLRKSAGQFEITKVPTPGTVTIKIYNIAGDLVKDGGYECINARGVTASLEQINQTDGGVTPDWNSGTGTGTIIGGRNFALRCTWDRTNNHGKQVARGLYYAIMELSPTMGNAKKAQKVIKILIP